MDCKHSRLHLHLCAASCSVYAHDRMYPVDVYCIQYNYTTPCRCHRTCITSQACAPAALFLSAVGDKKQTTCLLAAGYSPEMQCKRRASSCTAFVAGASFMFRNADASEKGARILHSSQATYHLHRAVLVLECACHHQRPNASAVGRQSQARDAVDGGLAVRSLYAPSDCRVPVVPVCALPATASRSPDMHRSC
jgi:hypothetical protein